MRYTLIEYRQGTFTLDGRTIIDGDKLELEWLDGQNAIVIVKIIQGEFRIVGALHGVKCWIILNFGIRKGEIKAAWPKEDGYG